MSFKHTLKAFFVYLSVTTKFNNNIITYKKKMHYTFILLKPFSRSHFPINVNDFYLKILNTIQGAM